MSVQYSDVQREPGCTTCKHYHGGVKCAAYPDAIPWPILAGAIDHYEPRPGDKGIVFEWRDDIAPEHRGPHHADQ